MIVKMLLLPKYFTIYYFKYVKANVMFVTGVINIRHKKTLNSRLDQ